MIELLDNDWEYIENIDAPDRRIYTKRNDEDVLKFVRNNSINYLSINDPALQELSNGFWSFLPVTYSSINAESLLLILQGPPATPDNFKHTPIEFVNLPQHQVDSVKNLLMQIVEEEYRNDPQFIMKLYAYITGSGAQPTSIRICLVGGEDLFVHTCFKQLDIGRNYLNDMSKLKDHLSKEIKNQKSTFTKG
jgi:hypothetical protein